MISQAVVLIVDDDLGFVTWLGVTLSRNGYATVPATRVTAAQRLMDELRVRPDLAIVNLALTSTIELIKALRRANPALKVIAIEDATPIVRRIGVDGTASRAGVGWLETVESALDLRNATGAS